MVRGTGTLGRDHGRTQRVTGDALPAKGRALVRLEQPLQDLAGVAERGFVDDDLASVKAERGVKR